MNPDNARILSITAAAGTEVADDFTQGTLLRGTRTAPCSPAKEVYNP